jgi:hypothetical protein
MSKFLRKMAAMSAKPSDFKPKPVAAATTKVTVPSVGTVPSIVKVPSMGTVPSKGTVPRVYRCNTVQDGHSFAEDRLYNALWNYRWAKVESDECRLVSVGWDLMAQLSGMTPNNARQNCFRLIQKLALEKVQAHNSEQRVGTTYRVYSYAAIIRRRRSAGMESVIRNRGGVTFVMAPYSKGTVPTEGTAPIEGTVLTEGMPSVPTEGTVSVPTEGTPLSHKEVMESQPSSSGVSIVSERVRKHLAVDDDVVHMVIRQCRRNDPDCTLEEVAEFAALSAAKICRQRNVDNPAGLLISQAPKFFPGSELSAYRARKAQELADGREMARRVLEDPQASPQELEWAKTMIPDGHPAENES